MKINEVTTEDDIDRLSDKDKSALYFITFTYKFWSDPAFFLFTLYMVKYRHFGEINRTVYKQIAAGIKTQIAFDGMMNETFLK